MRSREQEREERITRNSAPMSSQNKIKNDPLNFLLMYYNYVGNVIRLAISPRQMTGKDLATTGWFFLWNWLTHLTQIIAKLGSFMKWQVFAFKIMFFLSTVILRFFNNFLIVPIEIIVSAWILYTHNQSHYIEFPRSEASPVKKYTIDCEYLAYLKFITKS